MADRIGVQLGVDGEKAFRASINAANAELKSLGAEMAAVTAEFSKNASSQEALTAKSAVLTRSMESASQKIEILNKQIAAQKSGLDALKKDLDEASKAYAADSKEVLRAQNAYNVQAKKVYDLQTQLQKATAQLHSFTNASEENQAALDAMAAGVDNVSDGLDQAGNASLTFGNLVKANFTGNILASGVKQMASALKDFSVDTVATGKEFDREMSQVAATMGKTVDEIGELRQTALEYGAATKFTAEEAAEGLNILAQAGLNMRQQQAAIGDVLNLAAAGTISMADAAKYATGAVKGFKDNIENAQYYVDLMAKGATLANTSVAQLGEAMSAGAATAKNYGQRADSLTLALLRLAEQNVVGQEAATALNRAMADLYTPTEKARQQLDALGVSAYDLATGAARDVNEVMDQLNAALAAMTDQERAAALNAIFTTQGLSAFNKVVATGQEKVQEFANALANSYGSAAQQAGTQADNLAGDLDKFNSAVDLLKIGISDRLTPSLRGLTQAGTAVVTFLADLVSAGDDLPQVVKDVDALAAAMKNSAQEYRDNAAAIRENKEDTLAMEAYLESLAGVEEKTAYQKQAILDIVDQLNEAMPQLNLAYDEQADSLNMTAEAIRKVIEARAQEELMAEGIRRMTELQQEELKLTWQQEAAEEALRAARENAANVELGSSEQQQYAAQIETLKATISELDDAEKLLQEDMDALLKEFPPLADAMENTGDAAANAADGVTDLADYEFDAADQAAQAAEEFSVLTETSKTLAGAVSILSSALKEQADSGSLSLDTALKLIDAGYASALAIDGETKAITVNAEAYKALTEEKINDQIASLESQKQSLQNARDLEIEAEKAKNLGLTYLANAKLKIWQTYADDKKAVDAQIAALEKLKDGLDNYSGSAKSASGASKAAQTQAQKDLAAYKSLTAELDHQRNMDAISDREYYQKLTEYRDKYLTDAGNLDAYRQASEKIYKYDQQRLSQAKSLYENLADLEQQYQDTLTDRAREIASAYSLFDEVPEKQAVSGQKLINNLRGQVAALNEFYTGLTDLSQRLGDMGLSDAFVDEIRAMGPDAAGELNALLSLSDEKLTEYAEKYAEKQELANRFAVEALKGLRDETDRQILDNLADLSTLYDQETPEVGGAFTQGLSNAILEGLDDVTASAVNVAQAAVDAARRVFSSGMAGITQPGADVASRAAQSGVTASEAANQAAAHTVNGLAAMGGMQNVTMYATLVTPDGREISQQILQPLIDVSAANGTPFASTQRA